MPCRPPRPAQFWRAGQAAIQNFPKGIDVRIVLPNADGSRAVCLWEAESFDSFKDYLEGLLGHVSSNEYFTVAEENSLGLPISNFELDADGDDTEDYEDTTLDEGPPDSQRAVGLADDIGPHEDTSLDEGPPDRNHHEDTTNND